jgi:hypothetical protein
MVDLSPAGKIEVHSKKTTEDEEDDEQKDKFGSRGHWYLLKVKPDEVKWQITTKHFISGCNEVTAQALPNAITPSPIKGKWEQAPS